MIKAGDLTDVIKFERVTNTQSHNGDLISTFSEYLATYGKVVEKSGGYSFDTGTINSQSRIEITLRYRPDTAILTGDRVKWRGFAWIIENSPVIDLKRTTITMDAVLKIETTQR